MDAIRRLELNFMLDDLNRIKKFDTGKVAETIGLLPRQIEQVMKEVEKLKLPAAYKQVDKVVINGMGGSNIGTWILQSVFAERMKKPVILTPGYEVPGYVDNKTLYVFSSYSGTTEEPLSVFEEVKRRGAKMLAITIAGDSQLYKLVKKEKIPGYVFRPTANPSNQPRLGTGYSIFGISMLLARAGVFDIKKTEIVRLIETLDERTSWFAPGNLFMHNPAKQLAKKLFGKLPVLVAAEFLLGNVHALRNHFCENSKNFASYLFLPDLNHYAMEGLSAPAVLKKDLVFLFFDSALYHPRVQRRAELTKQVVKKNGIEVLEYKLSGESKLDQAFELLQFGMWLTFYLAILNQVNPAEIAWVDWFKKQLG